MLRLVIKQKCYLILFVIIGLKFFRGTECAICATNNTNYNNIMKTCAKEKKLADYNEFKCYPIFSTEPCNYKKEDKLKWFVYDSTCKSAQCVEKIDCENTTSNICPSCENPGEIRKYNVAGNVYCDCDLKLGLFKYNNTCYQSYSTGLCSPEERKVMVPDLKNGYSCIDSPCPEGKQKWVDGRCLEIKGKSCAHGIYIITVEREIVKSQPLVGIDDGLLDSNLPQEKLSGNPVLKCTSVLDFGTRATIDNCVQDSEGKCKNISNSPVEVLNIEEIDFFSILQDLESYNISS